MGVRASIVIVGIWHGQSMLLLSSCLAATCRSGFRVVRRGIVT